MAMVKMQSERFRFKFVDKLPTGLHHLKNAIHVGRVKTVKVDRMRVAAGV